MSGEAIKPGMPFRSNLVEEDVFLFPFHSTIRTGEALLRKFNREGAFVENEWYRIPPSSEWLHRTKEFDFVG